MINTIFNPSNPLVQHRPNCGVISCSFGYPIHGADRAWYVECLSKTQGNGPTRLAAGRNVRHRQQCTEQTFGMLENKDTQPWQTSQICAPLSCRESIVRSASSEGIFASGWASIIIQVPNCGYS